MILNKYSIYKLIFFRNNKAIKKMDNFRQRLCFSAPTVSDISLDLERENVRCLYFIIMF